MLWLHFCIPLPSIPLTPNARRGTDQGGIEPHRHPIATWYISLKIMATLIRWGSASKWFVWRLPPPDPLFSLRSQWATSPCLTAGFRNKWYKSKHWWEKCYSRDSAMWRSLKSIWIIPNLWNRWIRPRFVWYSWVLERCSARCSQQASLFGPENVVVQSLSCDIRSSHHHLGARDSVAEILMMMGILYILTRIRDDIAIPFFWI